MSVINSRKIAFPSVGEGLEGELSSHFGHAAGFTVIEFNPTSKEIISVEILKNAPHEYGGCMRPVMMLKDSGVTDIVVGGIGQRPLMGFQQVGIDIYNGIQGTIKQNFEAFREAQLKLLLESSCNHH